MTDQAAGASPVLTEGLGPRCRSETGDVMLCADARCGWMGRCVVAEPMEAGEGVVPCADCRTPNSCTPDGACLEAYIGMRLGMLREEAATLKVSLHHTECAAAAAEEDRDELLAHLSALVDRCAFDGVPNDSLPVWQAAHDAVMSRKRA